MASPNPKLDAQVEQAKADLAATQRTRSESRSARHARGSSDKSNSSDPIEEREEDPEPGRPAGRAGAPPSPAPQSTDGTTSSGYVPVPTPTQTQASSSGTQPPRNQSYSRAQATYGQVGRGSRGATPALQPENQVRPQAGQTRIPQDQVGALPANMTDAHRALLEELVDINGQDSYDSLAAGIGKLKRSEFLLLPNNINLEIVAPHLVGKPAAHGRLSVQDWANIYALNKDRAPDGADALNFALLRMEAVKAGWVEDQREISYANPPADALTVLAADMGQFRDRVQTIKTAAFLVPLIAEHVFRTYGHHFISTDAANYTQRYQDTLRSCLVPEISSILPAAALYHTALHWVSPGRARRVIAAQMEDQQIPDALKIRYNAAPAGTAILTTTAAILSSMKAVNLDVLFEKHGGFDVDGIHQVTALIKENPCKYHKAYFAYGIPGPAAEEIATVNRMKEEAIRFAPYAQAYIATYMQNAALGKAQALKKHAEQNPIQQRRAQNLFRSLGKADVASVEALFKTQLGRNEMDM